MTATQQGRAEPHGIDNREDAVVKNRENADIAAIAARSSEHLFSRNSHVDAFWGGFLQSERCEPWK